MLHFLTHLVLLLLLGGLVIYVRVRLLLSHPDRSPLKLRVPALGFLFAVAALSIFEAAVASNVAGHLLFGVTAASALIVCVAGVAALVSGR
jgi:hypothetical protein